MIWSSRRRSIRACRPRPSRRSARRSTKRATPMMYPQALRQPGSSFKPIVYLAALEHGMRPDDHFNDARIRIGNWEPRNYANKYRGDVTAADALALSINTVAAQVLERAGIDNVIATARKLGIMTDLTHDA